ncbi:MAG: DUF4115 domain-containing protein [Nitrosomonas sp.]|nr:DUF4115 domain-containing protein [Nitrosomonas sp.]MCW5606570.1 DUF4115 domain-containing protein [Nitrosomonas sp.]
MSNLFDNADNNHDKKTERDSGQKIDNAVFLSENRPSDPVEPAERRASADNEPEISHFLKHEAGVATRDTNTLDAASVVQGVGHMLRNARMARKMSIEDVSRQLRISIQQIEAIEKEDFDRLPGRTFVRGFVRNYANLMHLDANTAVQMLPGLTGMATHAAHVEHTPFKIQEMTPSSRESKGGGNILQIIALLTILAAVVYFGYNRLPFWQTAEESNSDQEQIVQLGDGQTTVELKLALPSLGLSANPAGTAQPNPGARISESVVVAQNAMANLNTIGTLVFNVTADTHIKVIDGNDDVIFDQKNIRGTQQRISGKRPLSVTIGKASAVELHYNDRVVDINPYTHPTKGSAHLMLE